MIGGARARRAATVIAIGLTVGVGFGLRPADPAEADPPLEAARRQALVTAAEAADAALARLADVLRDAIDHARSASAHTVAGDLPPGPELEAAADAVTLGAGTADAAFHAVEALSGLAAGIAPEVEVPALAYQAPDLLLMAVGLRSSLDQAALFVERRKATDAIVGALGEALSALDRDLPEAALSSLEAASAPLTLLDDWEERPPLLRYWMKVTRELIDAARDIATATIAKDPVAQAAAADRYGTAAEAARGADNALAVTLSEEGSAVSGIQLRRLAAAAAAVAGERAALQPLTVSGS